jgi:hypothetical protein
MQFGRFRTVRELRGPKPSLTYEPHVFFPITAPGFHRSCTLNQQYHTDFSSVRIAFTMNGCNLVFHTYLTGTHQQGRIICSQVLYSSPDQSHRRGAGITRFHRLLPTLQACILRYTEQRRRSSFQWRGCIPLSILKKSPQQTRWCL